MLVYGDTNSTLAGGLAAAQAQHPGRARRGGHALVRPPMPEELNRVLTDHLSELLLCRRRRAEQNLRARVGRRPRGRAVGDVMVDVSMMFQPRAKARPQAAARRGRDAGRVRPRHRRTAPGNVDVPERLRKLVDLLLALPGAGRPAAAPAHRRAPGRRRLARRAAVPPSTSAWRRRWATWPSPSLLTNARARADRLRRRAEGGLLRRRAVRDDARHDRVGRDGRRRAGTSSSTSTCTRR